MTTIEQLKYDFIFDEIFQASIYASFSTRNSNYPIYIKDCVKPTTLKKDLKTLVEAYIIRFRNKEIDENAHFNEISHISEVISLDSRYIDILHQSKFRIGISQKLLNLTLKYLWCIDIIEEPHHCPIDSIVINKIRPIVSNMIWTKLDSMEEYRIYINSIRAIANSEGKSIAK